MPFAWTAINVLDILAGNQVCGVCGGMEGIDCVCIQQSAGSGGVSETRKSSIADRDQSEKRGNTPEPKRGRDARSGSLSSQNSRSGLEDSYSASDAAKKDVAAQLTQNFCPVTLTVNAVFKQVQW